MTGLSAVAGAPGDAYVRVQLEEARKARAEHDSTKAAEPPPAEARTTESAVHETKFDRQDHEREQAEQEAHEEQTARGSLLDEMA
jgi:Flp pilus assembly protein TadD